MIRQFTGRHMAGILVAFFAVIIAVNLIMARLASATFGGAVVDNSYVASQHFNRWLEEAARERAQGLTAEVRRRNDGHVVVSLSGASPAKVAVLARHPLGRLPDREIAFAPAAAGTFVSRERLPAGRWRLRLTVTAPGRAWRTERELF